MSQDANLHYITAIVITYNEEANIRRTLTALTRLKEVIVLDSGSNDQTLPIASGFANVKTVIRPFDNLMNQWNYGHTLTENNWILSLDADYVVSTELMDELAALKRECAAYDVPLKYCIHGQPLKGSILPARPAFYDKRHCHYSQDGHAQFLNINGIRGKLNHPIFHDDRKTLSRWLKSQEGYADQEIDKLFSTNVQTGMVDRLRMKTIFAPFLIFLYTYFWKGGFRDGRKGTIYALQRMYAETLFLLKRMDHTSNHSDKS